MRTWPSNSPKACERSSWTSNNTVGRAIQIQHDISRHWNSRRSVKGFRLNRNLQRWPALAGHKWAVAILITWRYHVPFRPFAGANNTTDLPISTMPNFDFDYSTMFGNDSGENENPEYLDSYFVEQSAFKNFFSKERPLSIVRARKGMGKSSLLTRLLSHLKKERPFDIVISATGNELIGIGNFNSTDHAELENHWKQIICKRICIEIGKQIKWAARDDAMGLVEIAEIEGYKDQNIVSALASRVGHIVQSALGKAVDPSSETSATPEVYKIGLQNYHQALTRYQSDKDILVWVLIDDIDAKYRDTIENQERVGAFFSALRSLAFGVRNLRLRASIRSDVWTNLRRMEDQDKLRQYIIDIKWRDDELKEILAKKILAYLRTYHKAIAKPTWNATTHYQDIMSLVFSQYFKWGKKNEEPFYPIKTLAGHRPRWMGQLCRAAGELAPSRRDFKGQIWLDDIDNAMSTFGADKFSDLSKEHQHQFSDITKLVDAFKSGEREYNRFQLLRRIFDKYVSKVVAIPDIDGYPYVTTDDAVASKIASDQLGRFLFQIEFISPKRPDGRFELYQDNPDLFDSQENQQNKVIWAVSPSYRKYLRIT